MVYTHILSNYMDFNIIFINIITFHIYQYIDEICSLSISGNGKYMATGSYDITVKLIDIQSKKIIQKFKNIH